MAITVMTKDKGARTLEMPMTCVAPAAAIDPAELQAFAPEAQANGPFLASLLSQFCQQERDGVHLYRKVAGLTQNDAWRERYEQFGAETERHIEIYEDLVAALGGDPGFVSPAARLEEFRNSKVLEAGLLSGSVDPGTMELACLQMVLTAEQQCHANWELLGTLAERLPEGSAARQAIEAAVAEVEEQEDEHLRWAKNTWRATILAKASLVGRGRIG